MIDDLLVPGAAEVAHEDPRAESLKRTSAVEREARERRRVRRRREVRRRILRDRSGVVVISKEQRTESLVQPEDLVRVGRDAVGELDPGEARGVPPREEEHRAVRGVDVDARAVSLCDGDGFRQRVDRADAHRPRVEDDERDLVSLAGRRGERRFQRVEAHGVRCIDGQ